MLYDTVGTFASPRGLFTFKGELLQSQSKLTSAFGHDNVSILDGGLPAWIDEGGDVEEGPVEVSWKEEKYDGGELNKGMVKSEWSYLETANAHTSIRRHGLQLEEGPRFLRCRPRRAPDGPLYGPGP